MNERVRLSFKLLKCLNQKMKDNSVCFEQNDINLKENGEPSKGCSAGLAYSACNSTG
jgi:hypothetical protein